MRVVFILAIFLSVSNAESISSFLTDGENKTSTSLESKKLECYDLGILRQMINQETVIRLALVKNVHALINDFNLMKQSLALSEATVTELQRTIEALNLTVNSLQQENRKLQNNSRISEAKIMELETKLQTVNDNLNIIQEDSDRKRQEFFNKTNSVLYDIKIEVRYLSVTLLDFKESTENANDLRDKKYEELKRLFNNSFEKLKANTSKNELDSTNNKALIQNLADSQAEIRRTFTEILNKTVAKHETQLKTSAYEQLNLSSAVALLEAAHRNFSKSNCEPISSFLTDGENKTSALLESKDQEWNDLSILRQMINQETVIRLALVKNVHSLANDYYLIKQSLAASETRVNGQQQTIDALKIQVNSLQQENNELKNSSTISEARIMELETKLQTVNEKFITLHNELNVIQEDSNDKRREMFNKTHSVLDDIKIEVRYLSVMLLDFKESTESENESRDKKYEKLERYFNNSFEELKAENVQNKLNLTNNKVLIQNLDDSQSEIRGTFKEILNRTVTKIETQFKTFDYEQLKLSSAIASLEVANMNLSRSNCDKSNHHAFTAGISSYNYDWKGDILVFPVVIYSKGTGYNPSTGIFTAPTAGTYMFYISVQSAYQKHIYFEIVLNGSSKVRAMAWYNSGSSVSIYLTGTNLVILHLQTGDRVWVKRASGTGYHSDSGHITTFSGLKLY